MTHRRGRVDGAADHVGDRDRHTLGLARRVRQSVDQGEPGAGENLRGLLDALGGGGLAAADQGVWALLDAVLPEPRLA